MPFHLSQAALVRLAPLAGVLLLVAACAPEPIFVSRDQVVVRASSAEAAVRFAEEQCRRVGRKTVYQRDAYQSHWFGCVDEPKPLALAAPARAAVPSPPASAPVQESAPVGSTMTQTKQEASRPVSSPAPRALLRPGEEAKAVHPSEEPRRFDTVLPAGSSRYWVQVAASRSRIAAQAVADRMIRGYPDLLGGQRPTIVRGMHQGAVYFRTRFGPYAEARAARDLCARLKARRQDCFIATR